MKNNEYPNWPKQLKKTAQRIMVFDALRQSENPLSAEQIFLYLKRYEKPASLSTIYRALDDFLKHDLVQKADVRSDKTALYELNKGHTHYALCLKCNRTFEIKQCPLTEIAPQLIGEKFHVIGHKLQVTGYCNDCYISND